jgi:cysteinyl-tRNA synthetase
MCYDFNTPRAIASLFDMVTKINSFKEGHLDVNQLSTETFARLKKVYPEFIGDVLGLKNDTADAGDNQAMEGAMELILDLRQDARTNKDWATADKIRDGLAKHNIVVKDGKDGSHWTFN